MKSVAFATLGCKTNQYETDALIDLFHKAGYLVVDFEEPADIYIINTCTVTQMSDKKSRQMMRRAKKQNERALIVVLGCYAQISTDEVAAIDVVDIVIGTNDRGQVLHHIERYLSGETEKPLIVVEDIGHVTQFEELKLTELHTHTRAFIKIQEGCNQFCSYCIIPYARGRVRSRELSAIVEEVKRLIVKGYVEFVLTGIHIGSYGTDFKTSNETLMTLMQALNDIEGVKRIRLGSIEPTLIDEAFAQELSKLEKVCDHFHLSLQSGSNEILKKMNRKYTREDFLASVERLKRIYENPAITTDIIVGFPGETEEHFAETCDLVESVAFSEIHVFQYSAREGTPAAKMKPQIAPEIKKMRSESLIALGHEKKHAYQKQFLHQQCEIIIEEFKQGAWLGHTSNYLLVKIPIPSNGDLMQRPQSGQCITVEIVEASPEGLLGKFI